MNEKQFITKLINRHKSKVGWYSERAKHCKDQSIKDGFNRLGLWHLEELRYLEHNKKINREIMKKTAVKEVMNWILNNAVFHQTETLDGEINIHLLLDKKAIKKMFDKCLALEKEQLAESFDFGDYCVDLPDGSFEQKYKTFNEYFEQNYEK